MIALSAFASLAWPASGLTEIVQKGGKRNFSRMLWSPQSKHGRTANSVVARGADGECRKSRTATLCAVKPNVADLSAEWPQWVGSGHVSMSAPVEDGGEPERGR
jgi:hypothetical protein